MNISYKWLRRYLDFDLTPEELSAALTSIGLETGGIEQVESVRGGLKGLVIGKVLTCEAHPDSDHLHITTVDMGQSPVQIVCGAPNVAAGQTVVVAPVGTVLYSPDGEEFKIKRSKIRGVESLGMICAEDEIGIGTSHDGIIVLTGDNLPAPGTPAREVYKEKVDEDYVIEVDLTPNRIDAASHYGVARDLAAYLSCHAAPVSAHKPSVDTFAIDEPAKASVNVEVEASADCLRYCGLTFEDVKVGPSPEWLAKLLTTIGMHPINNVVDITNFILHAYGQPLHAFDADTLAGNKIIVRRADAGAKFTTLDGVERTLDAADLMICDSSRARCMAGVFGGLESGTTEATTRVFLESACFHPTTVRRAARRHGISTDSSFRFERGVDPNGCVYALKAAAILIKELTGARIVGNMVDIYPAPVLPAQVDTSFDQFNRLIGREIAPDTIVDILKSLECEVAVSGDKLHLAVPTYRVDVTRPCDVIEDVLRIYGYNNIAMSDSLHASLSFKTAVDAADDLRRVICEQLAGAGYSEILNNSLSAEKYYAENTVYPFDNCVRLLNPLSQDLAVMRQTLLYGGLETISHNINRRCPDLALYEFGNVYFRNPAKESTAEAPLAPYTENMRLGIWLTGASRQASWLRQAEQATVYELKAAVENVLKRCGVAARMVPAEANQMFAHMLTVETLRGEKLGFAGTLATGLLKAADIKVPVFYAELDWNRIARLAAAAAVTFKPVPKTQAVKRDLSLLLDNTVQMAEIEKVVRKADNRLITDVTLFDVYEGDKLPAGKKSYAITIILHDPEKTLQDKYIDRVMAKVIDNLRNTFNAELR